MRWPPLRTRSIPVLVRKSETLRPAVRPPLAMVSATEDSSDSIPFVTKITSLSVATCIVVSSSIGLGFQFPSIYSCRGAASLAGLPKELIGNPADLTVGWAADDDVLSDV